MHRYFHKPAGRRTSTQGCRSCWHSAVSDQGTPVRASICKPGCWCVSQQAHDACTPSLTCTGAAAELSEPVHNCMLQQGRPNPHPPRIHTGGGAAGTRSALCVKRYDLSTWFVATVSNCFLLPVPSRKSVVNWELPTLGEAKA